jgi:plasmid stabilization system protein ParE
VHSRGVEPCELVAWYASKTFDPVATVVVAETAVADLEDLIVTHRLPATTRMRVRASLEPLISFPLIGPSLRGRWQGFRFILGPWPWMLLVYEYDDAKDEVGIVTVQDSRSANAATSP